MDSGHPKIERNVSETSAGGQMLAEASKLVWVVDIRHSHRREVRIFWV